MSQWRSPSGVTSSGRTATSLFGVRNSSAATTDGARPPIQTHTRFTRKTSRCKTLSATIRPTTQGGAYMTGP